MQPDFHRWLVADFAAGTLTWKPRVQADLKATAPVGALVSWNNRHAGKPVLGGTHRQGYLRFFLFGKGYYRHRAIFCMAHGFMPRFVDHINGDTGDDRLENLREVSYRDNYLNQKMTKATGHIGVYPTPQGGWYASIRVHNKLKRLGTFGTEEEAIAARLEAQALYGFHPNHGRKT